MPLNHIKTISVSQTSAEDAECTYGARGVSTRVKVGDMQGETHMWDALVKSLLPSP